MRNIREHPITREEVENVFFNTMKREQERMLVGGITGMSLDMALRFIQSRPEEFEEFIKNYQSN